MDSVRVTPGMFPPSISTTPNSPTVWANKDGRRSQRASRHRQQHLEETCQRRHPDPRRRLAELPRHRPKPRHQRLHRERQRVHHGPNQQSGKAERQRMPQHAGDQPPDARSAAPAPPAGKTRSPSAAAPAAAPPAACTTVRSTPRPERSTTPAAPQAPAAGASSPPPAAVSTRAPPGPSPQSTTLGILTNLRREHKRSFALSPRGPHPNHLDQSCI